MIPAILCLFIIGYFLITLEHKIHLDKAVSALLMGTLIWALLALGFNQGWLSVIDSHVGVFSLLTGEDIGQEIGFKENVSHYFSAIGEILFFLIGAMTFV